MAIILIGKSKCAICGEVLAEGQAIHGTSSGVFLPREDPLWRYCDAGVHWDCYEAWPHRERFAGLKVEAHVQHERSTPYWHRVFMNEDVFVTVGTAMSPPMIDVQLLKVDSGIRVPLPEWEDWLQGEIDPKERRPLTLAALRSVRPILRQHLPDATAIWEALSQDRPDKTPVIERRQAQQRARDAAHAAEEQSRREAFELLVGRMRTIGLDCLWCTAPLSTDFRVALSALRLVCRSCGRSSGAADHGAAA